MIARAVAAAAAGGGVGGHKADGSVFRRRDDVADEMTSSK